MLNTKSFLQQIQKQKSKQLNITHKNAEDRKNLLDLNILVCIDVSGSICMTQVRQFMNHLDQIKGLSRVKVLEIDTQIVAFYDYFRINPKDIVRVGGSGGTEFTPAFKLAKDLQPDAILFMTDGFVSGNVSCSIPTGWIMTHDGTPNPPYGFGQIVHRFSTRGRD